MNKLKSKNGWVHECVVRVREMWQSSYETDVNFLIKNECNNVDMSFIEHTILMLMRIKKTNVMQKKKIDDGKKCCFFVNILQLKLQQVTSLVWNTPMTTAYEQRLLIAHYCRMGSLKFWKYL